MPSFTDYFGNPSHINPKYAGVDLQDPSVFQGFLQTHPDALIDPVQPTPAPSAPSPQLQQLLSAFGNSLNTGGQGSSINLGSAGLPGAVGAPKMVIPDYGAADAAFAQAKPHPIAAAQYVQPDYTKADSLWSQAAPAALSEDALTNDKWGKIIQGAAGAFLGAPQHKLMAAILGGLGGYGSALENRTKMSVDQANRQSDYLIKDAGYETGKAGDQANVTNNQATANYNADRSNQSSVENWAEALGGYSSRKAETKADIQNKQSELGFQANTRNADLAQQRMGAKVIGTNKDEVVYSWVDKQGNLNIGTKPIKSFSEMNGLTGGKMSGNDPGAAGMEGLIQTLRAGGALRSLLGPAYERLVQPESDYTSVDKGGLGSLMQLGDAGKKAAYDRAMAEENANIAQYLYSHPNLLQQGLSAIMPSK